MSKGTDKAETSASKAVVQRSLFGPPPVLEDKDRDAYDALLARVTKDLKPKDILENIWVRDAVDLTWEIFRWRSFTKDLLEEGLDEIDMIERVDRLATMAEARRNAALREIERHRSSFAQNLRQIVNDVQEAEFEVIEDKSSGKSAA